MKKIIYTLILAVTVTTSYSQFTGSCGPTANLTALRSCSPTECAPNSGSFMDISIEESYGSSIFPCVGRITYQNTVHYTAMTQNLTGQYQIEIKLEPAEYIHNLSLPEIPSYFTGSGTSISLEIPSGSPAALDSYPGYSVSLTTNESISITFNSSKGGSIPNTVFDLPVSFDLLEDIPMDTGVGELLYAGITGATNLPPNAKCQTRTTSVVAPYRCAFDPNEKIASANSCGENNLVSKNDDITYYLHFQNVGNAPANRVVLVDTLSQNLDFNTFQFLSATHEHRYELLPGSVLVVYFDNILLPDSTSDSEGSNGYFAFDIKPKNTLHPGNEISNYAYIYFDDNEPIITNDVIHTIKDEAQHTVIIEDNSRQFCAGNNYTFIASPAKSYLWSTGDTTQSITVYQPGIYTVEAEFEFSCQTSTDTAFLTQESDIPCCTVFASSLEEYLQGKVKNGSNLPTALTDASNALGENDEKGNQTFVNWVKEATVALGYDIPATAPVEGSITLGFDQPVIGELTVWTILTPNFDKLSSAEVYVSSGANGPWTHIGNANNETPSHKEHLYINSYPLIGSYSFVQYVKVVTNSPAGSENAPEGFNIEAVCASAISSSSQPSESKSSEAEAKYSPSGIEAPENYLVYPNPFDNHLQVENLSQEKESKMDVQIYDENGILVYEENGITESARIKTASRLPKGIYFLHLHVNNQIIIKKVIK